jgi:hypothetical protein
MIDESITQSLGRSVDSHMAESRPSGGGGCGGAKSLGMVIIPRRNQALGLWLFSHLPNDPFLGGDCASLASRTFQLLHACNNTWYFSIQFRWIDRGNALNNRNVSMGTFTSQTRIGHVVRSR